MKFSHRIVPCFYIRVVIVKQFIRALLTHEEHVTFLCPGHTIVSRTLLKVVQLVVFRLHTKSVIQGDVERAVGILLHNFFLSLNFCLVFEERHEVSTLRVAHYGDKLVEGGFKICVQHLLKIALFTPCVDGLVEHFMKCFIFICFVGFKVFQKFSQFRHTSGDFYPSTQVAVGRVGFFQDLVSDRDRRYYQQQLLDLTAVYVI